MHGSGAQTIVVTGASSGIGRELAIALAAPDRQIWLVGRDAARLAEVAGECRSKGADARPVPMDLADTDACARFLETGFPPEVKVDFLYLVAAVTTFGEVQNSLPEDWDRIYRINLLSPIQWTRHFYANMVGRGGGGIILVGSLAGYSGYPMATAYATMKAGLVGLYRSLSHEGKSHNISIHLASPGYVDTNIYKSAVFRGTNYEEVRAQISSLGFGAISARDSAQRIIRAVERGKREFAFPRYASLLKWTAPRLPFLIDRLHLKILRSFRKSK